MSRAAVGAKKARRAEEKRAREIDAHWARLELECRVDAMEVACEACGQEQVVSSKHVHALGWDGRQEFHLVPDTDCVVCGHGFGRFVRPIG